MRLGTALTFTVIGIATAGCAVQRAEVARDAQSKMIGLSKEQVLACMGAPASRMAEGSTEVWSYNSGNDHTTMIGSGYSNTQVSVTGGSGSSTGNATTTGSSFATSSRRYCTVNVAMIDGRVSRINYAGPTGGLLTQGEQCAFVVQNCMK